ncbi:PREDICTED: olfactory receptor 6N2-like [Nanorana parkeri]|uniref:olfactory receptor 6N2-like n=1 Tax=Nanorana parkeri TaxID=125878 RepID=UPI000854F7C0|nr:PREDICTED: olfactory receptor 6N2-like [Nanorana parkeri]
MELSNQSLVAQFIIVGFPDVGGYAALLFLLLLISYIFTLSGNVTIITLIGTHRQLHVPLYIFVAILSFLEMWYTTVTIPKMLTNLVNVKVISYTGCLLQIYFFHSLGITEAYLLTAMAFDRYMAICNPLRYPSIMTIVCCFQLAACCWVIGFIGPLTQIILLSHLLFCHSNLVKHIFCDFTPLMNLACSDTSLNIKVDFVINFFIIFVSFTCILLSYLKIISTVLKIKTAEGRKKAFSTCGAHLTVVFLFFGSVCFMYVRPIKTNSASYDRIMAVIYSVLTPMLNPVIYSLRNQEIRRVLKKKFAELFKDLV